MTIQDSLTLEAFLDSRLAEAPTIRFADVCPAPDGPDYVLTITNPGETRAVLTLTVQGDEFYRGRPGIWESARARFAVVEWAELLDAGVDLSSTLGPLRLFALDDETLECMADCVIEGFAQSSALASIVGVQHDAIREWLRRQLAGSPHGDSTSDPAHAQPTAGPNVRHITVNAVRGPDEPPAVVVWHIDPDVTVSHDTIAKGDTSGDRWTSNSTDAYVDVTSAGSRVKVAYSSTSKLVSTASGWISAPSTSFLVTHAGPDHSQAIRYDVKGTSYTVNRTD